MAPQQVQPAVRIRREERLTEPSTDEVRCRLEVNSRVGLGLGTYPRQFRVKRTLGREVNSENLYQAILKKLLHTLLKKHIQEWLGLYQARNLGGLGNRSNPGNTPDFG